MCSVILQFIAARPIVPIIESLVCLYSEIEVSNYDSARAPAFGLIHMYIRAFNELTALASSPPRSHRHRARQRLATEPAECARIDDDEYECLANIRRHAASSCFYSIHIFLRAYIYGILCMGSIKHTKPCAVSKRVRLMSC